MSNDNRTPPAATAAEPTGKDEPINVQVSVHRQAPDKTAAWLQFVGQTKWVFALLIILAMFRSSASELFGRLSELRAAGLELKAGGEPPAIDPATKRDVEALDGAARLSIFLWGEAYCFADPSIGEQLTKALREEKFYDGYVNAVDEPNCSKGMYRIKATPEKGIKTSRAVYGAVQQMFGSRVDKVREGTTAVMK